MKLANACTFVLRDCLDEILILQHVKLVRTFLMNFASDGECRTSSRNHGCGIDEEVTSRSKKCKDVQS